VNVYPYKTITTGKFTKYQVNILENGKIVVEHYFKKNLKLQTIFETQNDIKSSNLPKYIQKVACWAIYESKTLAINIESTENKWF
jgi:hypothetical protein